MKAFVLESPYRETGVSARYRGNWHNHTHRTFLPPEAAVDLLRSRGFDFLGVTEHDRRYRDLRWGPGDWRRCDGNGFAVMRGFEICHPLGHVTCLGRTPEEIGFDLDSIYGTTPAGSVEDGLYDAYLERARSAGAFLVLNHPATWRANLSQLLRSPALRLLHGVEIYNGHRLKRSWEDACATDVLDSCLGAGFRMWAGANPDCHSWDPGEPDGPFNGYSVVFARRLTPAALLTALKLGRFYATTGLEVESIRVSDTELEVSAPQCSAVTFVGRGGEILSEVRGSPAAYRVRGDEGYVRVGLVSDTLADSGQGRLPARAWLQPVWVAPASAG